MRHSATRALLERDDVIIVASVSCIYGIGSVETYGAMTQDLTAGAVYDQTQVMRDLIAQAYKRNDAAFARGAFRVRGDSLELWPAHMEDRAIRLNFFGDDLEKITEFDPLTGETFQDMEKVRIYANSHYVTPRPTLNQAIKSIKEELTVTLKRFQDEGKLLEAQRIEQRCNFDVEMLEATGVCQGIENYSRYLTGRAPGEPPPTLFEYIPDNALVFADESHVSVPQIGAMYKGDFKRKSTLAEHGFRLPSCMDNRPLKFEEWDAMRPQSVFVSATPSKWEMERTGGIFTEQVIRPTGLTDPPVEVRPVKMQVDDLVDDEQGIRVRYMHSDIDTVERIEIIRDLRLGAFDVLVGINLLREGLDIPECALVAILDADKEGFLRSETSLVILYADKITGSMERAMAETDRRRAKQIAYNEEHGITPESVKKNISDIMDSIYEKDRVTVKIKSGGKVKELVGDNMQKHLEHLRKEMIKAAENLEFEEAARIRDEVRHVLDFSNATFTEFFQDEFSIDIDSAEYAADGTSKARRLRAFLRHSSPRLAGRILRELWAYKKAPHRRKFERRLDMLPYSDEHEILDIEMGIDAREDEEFSEFVADIENRDQSEVLNAAASLATEFNLDTVMDDLQRARDFLDDDPEDSITAACSLLESLCKSILIELNEELPSKKSIKPLFSHTTKVLNLDAGRSDLSEDAKKVLSGLAGVIDGIGSLRTHAGDAHGREKGTKRVDARIAKLAVNSASAGAIFLIETWDRNFPERSLRNTAGDSRN